MYLVVFFVVVCGDLVFNLDLLAIDMVSHRWAMFCQCVIQVIFPGFSDMQEVSGVVGIAIL